MSSESTELYHLFHEARRHQCLKASKTLLLARAQLLTTFASPGSARIKTEDWGVRSTFYVEVVLIHHQLSPPHAPGIVADAQVDMTGL